MDASGGIAEIARDRRHRRDLNYKTSPQMTPIQLIGTDFEAFRAGLHGKHGGIDFIGQKGLTIRFFFAYNGQVSTRDLK